MHTERCYAGRISPWRHRTDYSRALDQGTSPVDVDRSAAGSPDRLTGIAAHGRVRFGLRNTAGTADGLAGRTRVLPSSLPIVDQVPLNHLVPAAGWLLLSRVGVARCALPGVTRLADRAVEQSRSRRDRDNSFVALGRIADEVVPAPSGSEQFARTGWTDHISRGVEGDQFKVDETMAADAQHVASTA